MASAVTSAATSAATRMPKQLPHRPQKHTRTKTAPLPNPPLPKISTPTRTKAPPPPVAPATSARSRRPAASAPGPPPESSPPLPAYSPAQRRLFAPLRTPQRILNGPTPLQTLSAALASFLLEKKLPREATIFMASTNDNGTVSITAPQG